MDKAIQVAENIAGWMLTVGSDTAPNLGTLIQMESKCLLHDVHSLCQQLVFAAVL